MGHTKWCQELLVSPGRPWCWERSSKPLTNSLFAARSVGPAPVPRAVPSCVVGCAVWLCPTRRGAVPFPV